MINPCMDDESIVMSLGKERLASRMAKLGMSRVEVYQLRSAARESNAEAKPDKTEVNRAYSFFSPGDLKNFYADEIKPGQPSGLPSSEIKKLADQIKAQGGRNWTPVIVEVTGMDQYKVVGNSHIYEAAKIAGTERMYSIVVKPGVNPYTPYVPETPRDHPPVAFPPGNRDIGLRMVVPISEIKQDFPSNATKAQINKMARQMKKQGTNWEPVIAQSTDYFSYKVIKNAHVYEAARKAGIKNISIVITGDEKIRI